MSVFSLLGRLGLNVRPWDQSLDHAEKKAHGFANRVEHKVGKKLDKAFGAGLITGAVISQFHKFFDLFNAGGEEAKGIAEMQKKFGLTAEGVQALAAAAKEDGQPVEEFIKKIQDSGGIDATIERLRELRKEVELTGDDVENLNAKDGLWGTLKKWAAGAEAGVHRGLVEAVTTAGAVASNMAGGMSPKEARDKAWADMEEAKVEAEKNRQQSFKDDEARARDLFTKPGESGSGAQRWSSAAKAGGALTPWQQVGAFIGTPGNVMEREQRETNLILRRLETLTKEQIRTLANSGRLFS